MRIAIPIILLYLGMATVTYGAMTASDDWRCHNRLTRTCDARMVREDKALAIAVAATPMGWIAALIVTAGYEDGMTFSRTPAR